jgi:DNA-binding CsgD family transcriptional regulator
MVLSPLLGGVRLREKRGEHVSDPGEPALTEMERRVLRLVGDEATERDIALELDLSPTEMIALLERAMYKLHGPVQPIISEKGHDHPADQSMDDEELLSHLHFMHARGVPRYNVLDPEELPGLHSRLHFDPPSPA